MRIELGSYQIWLVAFYLAFGRVELDYFSALQERKSVEQIWYGAFLPLTRRLIRLSMSLSTNRFF